jgi:hypothetical protein
MWAFFVAECGGDHEKFWDLSWFEWSLYARRHRINLLRIERMEESHWVRMRIQWVQFHNANYKQKVKPGDLLKLPGDEKPAKNQVTPDIEAVKKKFGAKATKRKKNGDK